MRRRYVGNTRGATSTSDFWDNHSLTVYRNRNQLDTSGCEGQTGARIPWFFHQHLVLGIQEKLRRHLQGLLRPGRNQNLRRIAPDAAKRTQIFRDAFTEWKMPHCVAIGHDGPRQHSRMSRYQLRPDVDWKLIESGQAHSKWAQVV